MEIKLEFSPQNYLIQLSQQDKIQWNRKSKPWGENIY